MTGLYALTIFLSAAILFLVQPMVGKMILPHLGGSPAVWNTCLLFFQAALLVGYVYAHLLGRLRRRWAQVALHAAALLLAAAALPFALPAGWTPDEHRPPALIVLAVLASLVALPFSVVAATGPLLQRWFSLSRATSARDPYFLYAASNAGSLLGLLAYPVLVEPALSLRNQASAWAAAFALFAALMLACGVAMARSRSAASDPQAPAPPSPPPCAALRLRWLLLAIVPSSLSMGASQFIATDVASAPLLWVLPLTVYLLTFIIAFSRWPVPIRPLAAAFVLAALAVGALQLPAAPAAPLPVMVAMHLLVLFLGALLAHAQLAASRPAADRLTHFYLLISLGGVLGAAFNALLAPLIFNQIWEYPIAIVAACLCIPARSSLPSTTRLLRAGLALAAILLAGLFAIGMLGRAYDGAVIHRERTFFGVHVVSEHARDPQGPAPALFHSLWHGVTRHGAQQMAPESAQLRPRAYYQPAGPLGSIFRLSHDQAFFDRLAAERRQADGVILRQPDTRRVAIVGMGAGAVAAYARAGDQYTFFEIDPAVDRIARDPALFTHVSKSPASIRTVLGDGRLKLAQAPPASFDLIILDAFSSDAVPYHLLTREAFDLYAGRLAPHGLIAVHVSNLHLDLSPVVASTSAASGFVAVRWLFQATPQMLREWCSGSEWIALARSEDDLLCLNLGPGTWEPLAPSPAVAPWTDDYSNLLAALRR